MSDNLLRKALCSSPTDDHSRVVLSLNDGDPESHYINANFVDVSQSCDTVSQLIYYIVLLALQYDVCVCTTQLIGMSSFAGL